jgi:glucokinase
LSLAIGVDVGGTKVAAGVVDEDGRIIAKLKRSTPAASPPLTEQAIADVVTELLDRRDVSAIGLGAAGFVDSARATMLFAPNLAWRDEPLKQRVEERLGRAVVVENDANASAWAEARFGAARGYRDVMLVAVGTGIGAAIIIGGELYRGRWGIAGEPGHVRVVPDGRLCGCGNRGCWEQYASGNALVAEAREFARRTPKGAMRLLQLGGGVPEGISGPEITQAATEGDPAALRCFQTVGSWLGQGLADLAAVLDPACFVIGGGVSEAGELLLDPARTAFERALTGRGHRPFAEIRVAQLGENAGIVGAADLARVAVVSPARRRRPASPARLRALLTRLPSSLLRRPRGGSVGTNTVQAAAPFGSRGSVLLSPGVGGVFRLAGILELPRRRRRHPRRPDPPGRARACAGREWRTRPRTPRPRGMPPIPTPTSRPRWPSSGSPARRTRPPRRPWPPGPAWATAAGWAG